MESELGISELCEVVEQCPAGGGEVDSGVRVEVGGEEKGRRKGEREGEEGAGTVEVIGTRGLEGEVVAKGTTREGGTEGSGEGDEEAEALREGEMAKRRLQLQAGMGLQCLRSTR